MFTVKNLTNSPHDLSIRLPAMGTVTAEFASEYIEAMRGYGYFEISEVHADPLDHDRNGQKGGAKLPADEPASSEDITTAIALLDAKEDAHWTAAGLPAVDAVAEIAGKSVTRAAINEAAPGVKRPAD